MGERAASGDGGALVTGGLAPVTGGAPVSREALGTGGALVTGGGRGLGRGLAFALAARGHAVHVTDVDEAAAKAVAEAVAEAIGTPAWGSGLDVTDEDACRAAAADTAERAGRLDVWVNAAGVLVPGVSWETDAEVRRRMFAVNLDGTVHGTFAALGQMIPAGRGHVLNLVSLAGLVPVPGEVLYAATKHAVLAFSVGTLLDLRRRGVRGVHVSALCPDGVWTAMLAERLDDPDAAMSWSGRLLQPDEVVAAAVRLLDRPRPVLSIPRYRGALSRVMAALPSAGLRVAPVFLALGRRKQRRWARRHRQPPAA